MDRPLKPGSVVFVETPEGVTHRDYVTHAWTQNPLKEVLVKMAATPALTRVAGGGLLRKPVIPVRGTLASLTPREFTA